ncbi:hypothetical protein [Streptomyces sp. Caat 7-52]|uniref:hypothetical protein n=1 Tax=Streptomyces sp. Caat 7-52 TaxID=2949637 RepID=UPI00203579C7|nr:hypothetical protein [Streptomyces sp. Caat 7-52]
MNDDRSTEFGYADEDSLLDQLMARADDAVLVSLETALEHEAGLTHIFQSSPSRIRRRDSGARPRVTPRRPPQDAITDQQHGSQRP